jgi:hypothetical protein
VLLVTAPRVSAEDGIREQQVQVKKGESGATIKGSIKGDQTVDYKLRANAGQTMGWLGEQFDSAIPQVAYEVKLAADGRSLEWIEQTAQGEVRYETEPGTSWFQRRGVDVMSILPIEWLL